MAASNAAAAVIALPPPLFCRFTKRINAALIQHPRINQTEAKFNRQILWQLAAEEQEEDAGTEQQPPCNKRPAPTSTPLLGKNSRSPN